MNSTNHVLHVYYALRDQHAFQKFLDLSKQSITLPKSSLRKSHFVPSSIDVNARDQLGRTVLHLACSDPSPSSLEYVKLLLTHPNINLNIRDEESHWTPLHRAGYAGNVAACVLLLQHGADTSLPDYEGYLPMDLYNSTVAGCYPSQENSSNRRSLFTWGTNRNAVLGHADGADRLYPEQVYIHREHSPSSAQVKAADEFRPESLCHVSMAKLHTVVTTTGNVDNVWVCGFGSGGRLGTLTQTQYKLSSLGSKMPSIKATALGQDHTLALSVDGGLYSWGLNRFSQLGYFLESIKPGAEPIQSSPRRVLGPLKKEAISGVATCKSASACWTTDGNVFTWGTNDGQLGYSSSAHPVQILPRVVSSVDFKVIDVALGESAMTCISVIGDVVCFIGDTHYRIPFVHPHLHFNFLRQGRVSIRKAITSDNIFAFLARDGDVFMLNLSEEKRELNKGANKQAVLKPQRVWVKRQEFSDAQDIALDSNATLVVCTKSGHVFVKSKQGKLIGGAKYLRVPYIQRVVNVDANSAGSFAALKQEFLPGPSLTVRQSLADAFRKILPKGVLEPHGGAQFQVESRQFIFEDDEQYESIFSHQVTLATQLLHTLTQLEMKPSAPLLLGSTSGLSRDSFLLICAELQVFVHASLLFARCPSLASLAKSHLDGRVSIQFRLHNSGHRQIVFTECHPLSLICLVLYLYTDEVLAVWDRRISSLLKSTLQSLDTQRIQSELLSLAQLFHLPELESVARLTGVHKPIPTLSRDLHCLFESLCRIGSSPYPSHVVQCDVKLLLEDRIFQCSSCVLQARSPFFASFFGDSTWTSSRRSQEGFIEMLLPHIKWCFAKLVLAHIYYGAQEELFDSFEDAATLDDAIDFVFEVLSIANELLLDDLTVVCTNVMLRYLSIQNISAILTEASHLGVQVLLRKLYHYIAVNLETLLEYSVLDDLPSWILINIGQGIRELQRAHSPYIHSGANMQTLLQQHRAWLDELDIPRPILPTRVASSKSKTGISISRIPLTGKQENLGISVATEGDGDNTTFCPEDENQRNLPVKEPVWKAPSIQKSERRPNLRSIIHEAEMSIKRDPAIEETRSSNQHKFTNPRITAAQMRGKSSQINRLDLAIVQQNTSPPSKQTGSDSLDDPNIGPSRLGPTFTPKPALTSSPRVSARAASGRPVWNRLASVASLSSTVPSNSGNLSFLNIQQQQLEQSPSPSKQNLSIKEIQEQEKAQQEEKEFLRWWATEEERVRREQIEIESLGQNSPRKGKAIRGVRGAGKNGRKIGKR